MGSESEQAVPWWRSTRTEFLLRTVVAAVFLGLAVDHWIDGQYWKAALTAAPGLLAAWSLRDLYRRYRRDRA